MEGESYKLWVISYELYKVKFNNKIEHWFKFLDGLTFNKKILHRVAQRIHIVTQSTN